MSYIVPNIVSPFSHSKNRHRNQSNKGDTESKEYALYLYYKVRDFLLPFYLFIFYLYYLTFYCHE